MRCVICNKSLTDYEATRKHALTQEFLDMCSECVGAVCQDAPIPYKDRPDLWGEYDSDDEYEEDVDGYENL